MNQTREHSLIQGNILKSLISFAFPVLLALFFTGHVRCGRPDYRGAVRGHL